MKWTIPILLPHLPDNFLALLLACVACAVGGTLMTLPRFVPKDESAHPFYRYFRMAVILVTSILAFAVVGIAVVLFAMTAFGRPPASPALEYFEENPAQREHQTRHYHQRRAEHDHAGDEYQIVFQTKAQICYQHGNEHSRREDVEYLLHQIESLEPTAVIGGWRSRWRGFGVRGRLRAFAGNGGGVLQFGGSHNRAILDLV